jgi:hypothetical protein
MSTSKTPAATPTPAPTPAPKPRALPKPMEKFHVHIGTCTMCKGNPPGTRPYAMKLCMEGMVLRADAFMAPEKVAYVRLGIVLVLVGAAVALVGVKFGAEAAIATTLLSVASQIKVRE